MEVPQQPQQIEVIKRDKKIKINSVSFQINIIHKNIDKNIQRLKISLASYSKKDNLDLVLFPEMALMGYNFQDEQDVLPFAEQQQKGNTFQFGQETAKKLNSYVVIGYPELYVNEKDEYEFYSSAYLIDREGKLIQNIRKKHLYASDKTWAKEGQEFKSIELLNHEGVAFKTSIGICMDINPYEFKDNSAFEWADFIKSNDVDVVILIQNWVDSEPHRDDGDSVTGLIDYFLWRLRPLTNVKKEIRYHKSWLFLTCNRTGKEDNVLYEKGSKDYFKQDKECVYAGSTVSVKLNPTELVYVLEKRSEGILKSEVTLE